MPIPDDLRDILNMVAKATNEGRRIWTQGPAQEMLFFDVDDFAVQLWKKFRPGRTPNGQFPITFSIFDKGGAPVKSITLDATDPDFGTLEVLYRMASQMVQGATDDRLSKFKQQLAEKFGV